MRSATSGMDSAPPTEGGADEKAETFFSQRWDKPGSEPKQVREEKGEAGLSPWLQGTGRAKKGLQKGLLGLMRSLARWTTSPIVLN